MLARLIVQERLTHVSEATGEFHFRTTDSGAAKGCFSDWGAEAESSVANRYAMTSPVRLGTNSPHRSGTPARIVRAPRSSPGGEAAQEAVCAKQAHTRVAAEGLPTFLNRESRSPSAGSRSAVGRRTLRVSRPTTRASDFHWRHRTARPSHEPFCPALAPRSEPLPSGATEGQAEDQAASEPRRWCRPEPQLARTRRTSWRTQRANTAIEGTRERAQLACGRSPRIASWAAILDRFLGS